MRIYYVTLNTADEARQISRVLLERQFAVCTNWFPITCAYRWEGKTVEEAETVLLIKTQSGYRSTVEQVIREHVSYTNFIAEIAPESVNEGYLKWLNTEVPAAPNVRTELAVEDSGIK
jgi:periplasmic divalent cation tolerance protein